MYENVLNLKRPGPNPHIGRVAIVSSQYKDSAQAPACYKKVYYCKKESNHMLGLFIYIYIYMSLTPLKRSYMRIFYIYIYMYIFI